MHAFNPSTQEAEAGGSLSLRTAWATQRNPVSRLPVPNKKNIAWTSPATAMLNVESLLSLCINWPLFLFQGTLAGILIGLAQLNCSELKLKRLFYRHG